MLTLHQGLRIVLAPDSYKESLSASKAAEAMRRGVLMAMPDAQVVMVPMADGGEGSLDAVLAATGGERRHACVNDANGRPRQAAWGWLGDGKAFIEMAEAAGLEHIPPQERRPLHASTFGVGQLVLAALDAGARHIVLSLGGSATTDAGAGLFQALGGRLLNKNGADLPPGGAALQALACIQADTLDSRLAHTQFELAVDVDNPLCGPSGAAAIFGPQKGATARDVELLDQALSHFADISRQAGGRDVSTQPGTGAAGGLGFVIKAFFHAEFRPGVELIADLAGLEAALQGAQLVFTGEGRLDRQTLLGKTPAGVARLARRHGVTAIAVAGSLGEGYESLYEIGLTAAFSLVSGPMSLAQACEQTSDLLAERTRDIVLLWAAGR